MKAYPVNVLEGTQTTEATHYLVLDRDDISVLAWFPIEQGGAKEQATKMARDLGHKVGVSRWVGGATDGYWGRIFYVEETGKEG